MGITEPLSEVRSVLGLDTITARAFSLRRRAFSDVADEWESAQRRESVDAELICCRLHAGNKICDGPECLDAGQRIFSDLRLTIRLDWIDRVRGRPPGIKAIS